MDDTAITHGDGYTLLTGDAITWYRACVLEQALRLYGNARILAVRGVKATDLLKMAAGITRKAYRRGDYLRAAADVKEWCDAMRAALPDIDKRT